MEWNREEGESDLQVFINHRGTDVKKKLASLLYYPLKNAGLRVFLDQKELQTGDSVTPAIIKAVVSSSVYIAIFSPNYAHSGWCLEELCLMLKYRDDRTIIPIFCDVQPSELRHLDRGPYAQDFHNHKHNGRVSMEVVERWEKALKEASEIKGHVFNTEESDQGEFVNIIVHTVLDKVKGEPLEYRVGLDKAAENFQNEILSRREVTATTVVGIVGLGGSGKTTLVAHLYNLIRSEFKKCAFLSEVSKTDLLHLLQCLLDDLIGNYNCKIKDTREGRSNLVSRLRELPQDPVLIVLDNTDDSEKTEDLLSVKDVLPQRSLILVTSRYKGLLSRLPQVKLYDIKLLDGKYARQLFCRYAFSLSKPRRGFEDLVERFVKICNGFPLALKVLGRQVYGKLDQSFWERQLDNLQRGQVPGDMVERVLEVSYNTLNSTEKEIFLDIAHFFVGEDKDLVEKVLEGLDPSASDCLETLRHKCLVEFENADEDFYLKQMYAWDWRTEHCRRRKGSSKIKMHDLVKELARQISSDTKPLCHFYPDHNIIWKNRQSRPLYVRGIHSGEERKKFEFVKNEDIRQLRYLVLDDSILPSSGLSGDLLWLRLCKTRNSIPASLSLRRVRVLELDGIRHQDMDKILGDEPPSQLSELTIDFPKHDGRRERNRRRPRLHGVLGEALDNWFDKQKADSSPSILHSLNRWFGKLKPMILTKLVLKNVESLVSFPINFEELGNLRHLDLSGWCDLEVLPGSFTELLQLQYLALADCRKLSIKDLGKISKLEYLDFEGCSLLEELPKGTTAQRSLRYLNLVDTGLLEVPDDFAELENLEQLLIGSPKLTDLQPFIKNLNRLKSLTLFAHGDFGEIDECLRGLPNLRNLERVQVCIFGWDAHFVNEETIDTSHMISSRLNKLSKLKQRSVHIVPFENFLKKLNNGGEIKLPKGERFKYGGN